jgi:hypothetical protein
MFHVTLGYCFVNRWARSIASGKPVSKYPDKVTGLVPQFAAKLAAALVAPRREAAWTAVGVTMTIVAASKPAKAE